MAKTTCNAKMRFSDVTAIADSSVVTTSNQSIGSVVPFSKENNIIIPSWGTLEKNQFVLNGQRSILPDDPQNVAFWSSEKSENDCTFTNLPTITVTFSKNHSSSGITLYFSDDYPVSLTVTWYSLGGEKIEKKDFSPDSLIYFCKNQVENYGKIVIEFTETRLPNRYIKLQYILYGMYLEWAEDLLMSVTVHEEVDETSDILSINTAEVKIHDERYDFDIANMDGAWRSIQREQPFILTETKNGKEIPMGTYYIDDHKFSENTATFSLIDTIGRMDRITFRDGEIYINVKAGKIMESIFAAANVDNYNIDTELYDISLSGHLETQTCREALKMVCFAIGALADDSRSDTVRIYKPTRYVVSEVGPSRKMQGQTKMELDEYVNGVSITSANYTLQSDSQNIYDDNLPAGTSVIDFTAPCQPSSVSISGGTLEKIKTNYAIVKMSSEGKCTLTGKSYTKKTFKNSVSETAKAGEAENIKEYGVVTLYNSAQIEDKLASLFSYLKLRKKLSMEYFVDTEQSGNWVNVKDINKNISTTLVESQDIDLTGGFISKATCRGYNIVVTNMYYTGSELYAGGDFLL